AKHKLQSDPAYWKQLTTLLVNEGFKRMEPSGGWGHTSRVPCPLGYVELEVVSNWMLAMLGAAQQQGARLPADKLSKALEFIERGCHTGRGAVGYSPRPGQKGHGCVGGNGGAIFAFALLKRQDHQLYAPMVDYWRDHVEASGDGHGSAALGLLGS